MPGPVSPRISSLSRRSCALHRGGGIGDADVVLGRRAAEPRELGGVEARAGRAGERTERGVARDDAHHGAVLRRGVVDVARRHDSCRRPACSAAPRSDCPADACRCAGRPCGPTGRSRRPARSRSPSSRSCRRTAAPPRRRRRATSTASGERRLSSQSSASYGPVGSISDCRRSDAARAMRSIMLLRVDACSLCSGASHTISAPNASATISPVSGGKISHGTSVRGGEEQPVAVHPIVHPFLVGAEIRHRGLDLDDPDFAVAAERHQIGAAARGERQLADAAEAERDAAAARCRAPPRARSAIAGRRPESP